MLRLIFLPNVPRATCIPGAMSRVQIRNWSGNAGDAGAKPLLGLVNTVQCHVRAWGRSPYLVQQILFSERSSGAGVKPLLG